MATRSGDTSFLKSSALLSLQACQVAFSFAIITSSSGFFIDSLVSVFKGLRVISWIGCSTLKLVRVGLALHASAVALPAVAKTNLSLALSAAQQAARSVKEFRRYPNRMLFDLRFEFFRVSEATRASAAATMALNRGSSRMQSRSGSTLA